MTRVLSVKQVGNVTLVFLESQFFLSLFQVVLKPVIFRFNELQVESVVQSSGYCSAKSS